MAILFDQLRDFVYIYRYDDSGGSWSANLNDSATLDYFDDDATVGDNIVFGYNKSSGYPFHDLRFNVGTPLAASNISVVWEYKKNYAWAAIPSVTDNTNAFQNAGVNSVTFSVPENWSESPTINGKQGYMVRCRITAVTNISEGGAQQTDKVQAKDWAIEVTGYSALTPCEAVDIWNADQAGGWGVFTRDGDKLYHCESNLFIGDDLTTSYLTFKNLALVLESKLVIKANGVFDLGILEDVVENTTISGAYFYYTRKYAAAYQGHYLNSSGEFNVYGSCVAGDYYAPQFTKLINSTLDDCMGALPQSASAEFDRVNIGTSVSGKGGIVPNYSASFSDIFISEYAYSLDNWANNRTITVSNLKGRNNTYIWRVRGSNGKNETLNLDNADTDTWNIYWDNTYYTASYLNRRYTIDLQILDGNNNGIQGAVVKLEDKDGAEIFSLTTDVNGEITQQTVISHQYSWASGKDPGVSADIDYNDFTLTIQKTGYQTYSKQFTLDEKIDWRVAMLDEIPRALTFRTEREISFKSPERKLAFTASGREL